MKVSYKAALLSTFVFPGVGQLYLKKYWRGLVIMFLSCAGLGCMIWIPFVGEFLNAIPGDGLAKNNIKTVWFYDPQKVTDDYAEKDEDTGAHIKRMSNYSAAVARQMGLSKDAVETI